MSRPPTLAARMAAALLAAMVIALALFSVSPTMHGWLHAADQDTSCETSHGHDEHGEAPVGDSDHVCAVTLFARGVVALLVFCLLLSARPLARGMHLRPADWLTVGRPRYWLVPSHAPPAA